MENSRYYSKTLEALKSLSNEEITKRYLKRNHKNQQKLNTILDVVINKRQDDQETFVYGALACLEGSNLSHIILEVFQKNNPTVINAGYQFKVENIISDINKILNDNPVLVIQSRKNRNVVSDYISETIEDYVANVLIEKVLTPVLQNEITVQ